MTGGPLLAAAIAELACTRCHNDPLVPRCVECRGAGRNTATIALLTMLTAAAIAQARAQGAGR